MYLGCLATSRWARRAAGSRSRSVLVVPVVLVLASLPALATEFHVTAGGTTSTAPGTGSASKPWSLATALAQPAAVHAGDTIWVHGGTYKGPFSSHLVGTSSAPIVVRAVPGERATLDGGTVSNPVLEVGGAYTWIWGLEVMSSDTDRTSAQKGTAPTDLARPEGVTTFQKPGVVGIKLINLVVHDARGGVSMWRDAVNAELYGSIVYYNGWRDAAGEGHGHGVYVQNDDGTKRIADNIVFRNFSHGLHAYSGEPLLDDIVYDGNTVFSNGEPGGAYTRNLLIGGGSQAHRPVWNANMTYVPPPAGSNELGLGSGCTDAKVTNNYFAGTARALEIVSCSSGLTLTGNTFFGIYAPVGFSKSSFPSNTYLSARPDHPVVFVRANEYEKGRANVTVYDWTQVPEVAVDLSSVLAKGAAYEIRDAQRFFGPAVVTGTYDGNAVKVRMHDLPPDVPVGAPALPPTEPEFGVFVVLTKSAPAATPTSTPTPTPTPTPTSSPKSTPTPPPTPTPRAVAPAPAPASTPLPRPAKLREDAPVLP
jgi:hypothetical protein